MAPVAFRRPGLAAVLWPGSMEQVEGAMLQGVGVLPPGGIKSKGLHAGGCESSRRSGTHQAKWRRCCRTRAVAGGAQVKLPALHGVSYVWFSDEGASLTAKCLSMLLWPWAGRLLQVGRDGEHVAVATADLFSTVVFSIDWVDDVLREFGIRLRICSMKCKVLWNRLFFLPQRVLAERLQNTLPAPSSCPYASFPQPRNLHQEGPLFRGSLPCKAVACQWPWKVVATM